MHGRPRGRPSRPPARRPSRSAPARNCPTRARSRQTATSTGCRSPSGRRRSPSTRRRSAPRPDVGGTRLRSSRFVAFFASLQALSVPLVATVETPETSPPAILLLEGAIRFDGIHTGAGPSPTGASASRAVLRRYGAWPRIADCSAADQLPCMPFARRCRTSSEARRPPLASGKGLPVSLREVLQHLVVQR